MVYTSQVPARIIFYLSLSLNSLMQNLDIFLHLIKIYVDLSSMSYDMEKTTKKHCPCQNLFITYILLCRISLLY